MGDAGVARPALVLSPAFMSSKKVLTNLLQTPAKTVSEVFLYSLSQDVATLLLLVATISYTSAMQLTKLQDPRETVVSRRVTMTTPWPGALAFLGTKGPNLLAHPDSGRGNLVTCFGDMSLKTDAHNRNIWFASVFLLSLTSPWGRSQIRCHSFIHLLGAVYL